MAYDPRVTQDPRIMRAQYYELPRTSKLQWRRLARAIAAAFMSTFAIYLVVCLGVLVIGVDIVMPVLGERSFSLYVVFVALVSVGTISGAALQAWYIFLVSAILASAVWLALRSGPKYLKELTMRGAPRDHSPFFDLCALMFAVLFINTVVVLILMLAGQEPTAPVEGMEDWELLFLLANASVWEELIVRVLLLGLPLMVVDLARGTRLRKLRRYVLGGHIDIMWGEAALVVLSSVIFGFAHFEAWGLWKVFPSSIAGLAFGYMFLKHGLPAAIMLHFSFDYLSMPLTILDQSFALQMIVAIGILLWAGLGLMFTVYFSVRIVEFLSKRRFFEEERPSPAAVTAVATRLPGRPGQGGQAWGYPPNQPERTVQNRVGTAPPPGGGFFVCPVCGSTNARLDGARGIICLGCGRSYE